MKRLTAITIAAALLFAACGGEDAPAPQPPDVAAETADPLPKLPPGWEPYINRVAGFSFGLPPGWRARESGSATQVRSLDKLVAITISADRTDGALVVAPTDFARQTLTVLPGYEKFPDPDRERKFRHRYEGALAGGAAVSDAGERQDVSVIVLRREGLAVLTAVIAARAEQRQGKVSARIAELLIRTLRSRPVGT